MEAEEVAKEAVEAAAGAAAVAAAAHVVVGGPAARFLVRVEALVVEPSHRMGPAGAGLQLFLLASRSQDASRVGERAIRCMVHSTCFP